MVVSAGLDHGLTGAGEVVFPDGRRQVLRANGGLGLAIGALLPLGPQGRYEVQATIGRKADQVGTSTAGLRYVAYPLEVLVARTSSAGRLAAGVSLSVGPTLRGGGAAAYLTHEFRSALGLVAQAELVALNPSTGIRSAIGLRLTWQSLNAKDGRSGSDATAIGLIAGFTL